MKRSDIYFIVFVALVFAPFFIVPGMLDGYEAFNKAHGVLTSFFKFAFLATLGEVIALRIRTGVYHKEGFGIAPRAVVWGFLGVTVLFAFKIFSSGTPALLAYLGMDDAPQIITGALTLYKVLVAFLISVALNLIYAPVLMTLHKVTDEHIIMNGGTLRGLFRPIDCARILRQINWDIQWHFVFKKTIPLFWIPAHTMTFLLTPEYQVLFAAMLSVALGVFLAIASLRGRQ